MRRRRRGLTVIAGCMFSGKTSYLISLLSNRKNHGGQKVQAFYPYTDTRTEHGFITARGPNGTEIRFPAKEVESAGGILEALDSDTVLVAIDEAQFFDESLADVCRRLLHEREVVVAGLDTDFRGQPFGPMPGILAVATEVEKLTALCAVCGEDAYCTQRLVNGQPARYDDPVVLVGGVKEGYEARCLLHHEVWGEIS